MTLAKDGVLTLSVIRYSIPTYLLALFLSFTGQLLAGTADSFLDAGDSSFSTFDYAGSAELYRQAATADSQSFDAFWKLGRSLNYLGELVPRDSQLAIFVEASSSEQSALKLDDNSADAHFQLARSLGKIALFKGVFKSIGLAKQVKAEAEKALALDSLHDGAWHILGRWNREVAKKPKIFRSPMGLGSANKRDAIAFMQKALSLNPGLINHHLEMGITYREYGMKDRARDEFNRCLALPGRGPLDKKYKDEAQKYLAGLDKK
jgi:tetratricopeptide (TPR) repeat protein